jgi:mannose-1-phosphate guanylyltransferase
LFEPALTPTVAGRNIPLAMFALILAGGVGERLRPLTESLPKPMIPLDGRPILWHQVRWLRDAGVTDVVFLLGHLAEVVVDYFGDGSEFGIRAHYSYEDAPLGRGGALRKGFELMPSGTDELVIATNGDVVTEANLDDMINDFSSRVDADAGHLATILTVSMTSPYGIVETDIDGVVRAFKEKSALPYEINAGVYVLNPAICKLLPERGDHEVTTFPVLALRGQMSAVHSGAFWRSVDSLKDLREVEQHIASERCRASKVCIDNSF